MAFPFFNSGARRKRDQVVAIDLGGRTTKAVFIQRRGEGFALVRYALLDAPIYEKNLSVDMLTEHLKAVAQALEVKGKPVTVAVGVNDSFMRHVEMPKMPVDDMRLVLKMNSKTYLQQDLPNYVYDCFVIPPKYVATPADAAKVANSPVMKQKVLVAGTRRQLADDYQTAIKAAGMLPDYLMPGLVGPVNAFEATQPEQFARSVVALVDIGFKHSSISVLSEGELILNRVVAIGGDRLTTGLAETMSISYAEAEGIKIGMASEVQPILETFLLPLGRELRASLDFFEHQQDRTIGQVYLSGASVRSEFVVQSLQNEMMVECKTWLPTATLQMALPAQQTAEVDQVASQLTTAIGAAMAAF
jgi:type IV pilus assembly protein PilM